MSLKKPFAFDFLQNKNIVTADLRTDTIKSIVTELME